MAKKLISLLLALTVFAGAMTLTGCKSLEQQFEYFDDIVSVYFKPESKEKVQSCGFTKEDLGWDNIDTNDGELYITYWHWHDKSAPEYGKIDIHLKDKGSDEVRAAIEHFENMDNVYKATPVIKFERFKEEFRENVEVPFIGNMLSYINVFIKSEYKQKYLEQSFTAEDFGVSNILAMDYSYDWVDSGRRLRDNDGKEYGMMKILLTKVSENKVKAAAKKIGKSKYVDKTSFELFHKGLVGDYLLVSMTKEETRKFLKYTTEDFYEINAVRLYEMGARLTEWVEKKVKGIPTDEEMLVNIATFCRIFVIYLPTNDVEQALRAAEILSQREGIDSAGLDEANSIMFD